MQNQIKVDKNRKGILFFLDFGPLICGAGRFAPPGNSCLSLSGPFIAIVRCKYIAGYYDYVPL
jgi:hypothetical protein